MSKITVTTIAGQTSGSDANKVKIESGDTLEVTSNATVGGDLTVDTSTLKVDSSNNKIGIGLTSPQELLHIKDGSIAVGNGTASNNSLVGKIGFSTDSSNSRFIGMECFRGSDAANADLRFHTFGGDSDSGERMRIHTNGVVSCADGIALGVGTANTTSNVLDDYEEGTWTPSVGGNATYHAQHGNYTKIGRLVHAHGYMQVNVLGTGSTTTMSGFPFVHASAGSANMSGSIGLFLYLAVNVLNLEMYFSNGNTSTAFKGNTSASGNQSGNLAIFGNSARVDFSITYETSA